MIYITIISSLVLLTLLFIFLKPANLSKHMGSLADNAVSDAKTRYNYDLDMSEASLESVNQILQKLHQQNSDDTQNLSLMYGAYTGKVIMNLYTDGVWLKNHPTAGRNTYPVKFSNGQYALPVSWARDHLANGEDNNILYRFISFKHSREDG